MNFSGDPDEFDGFDPGSVPDFSNGEEGNWGGSRSASTAGSGGGKGPGPDEDNYDKVARGASSSEDGQGIAFLDPCFSCVEAGVCLCRFKSVWSWVHIH